MQDNIIDWAHFEQMQIRTRQIQATKLTEKAKISAYFQLAPHLGVIK